MECSVGLSDPFGLKYASSPWFPDFLSDLPIVKNRVWKSPIIMLPPLPSYQLVFNIFMCSDLGAYIFTTVIFS